MAFIKKEGHPALAALMGNVFHLRRQDKDVTFFLDQSRANLIPMLKSHPHQSSLSNLAEQFFDAPQHLHFAIAADPMLRRQQEREAKALEDVKADPKIQFILEQFRGTIIKCRILEKQGEGGHDRSRGHDE